METKYDILTNEEKILLKECMSLMANHIEANIPEFFRNERGKRVIELHNNNMEDFDVKDYQVSFWMLSDCLQKINQMGYGMSRYNIYEEPTNFTIRYILICRN